MNEHGQNFSPADMILAHRKKQEESVLKLPEEGDPALEKIVEDQIITPLVTLIETTKLNAQERTVTVDETVEGKAGYTPRSEKVRAVRALLKGFNVSKIKEDHREREIIVAEESKPEEVSIHIFVDAGPTLRGKLNKVKKILTVLKMVNELSPAVLNARQQETVIKKIHLSVDVLVGTVDGNRTVHLGEDLPTEVLLTEYMKLLQETVHSVDHSPHPRMGYPAKVNDVLQRSLEVEQKERRERNVIHHHAMLFSSTQYKNGVKFQVATNAAKVMIV